MDNASPCVVVAPRDYEKARLQARAFADMGIRQIVFDDAEMQAVFLAKLAALRELLSERQSEPVRGL